MSLILPFGPDRSMGPGTYFTNGSQGNLGTATPTDAVVATSPAFFEEDSDSPTIELAEQATIVHSFHCNWATALAVVTTPSPYFRGNIFTDTNGDTYKILSTTIQHQRGEVAKVQIITEATSFGLPPDEFNVEVLEFNPAIQKHPRYAGLGHSYLLLLTQRIMQASSTAMQQSEINRIDAAWPPPGSPGSPRTDMNAAAHELANKLIRGEETFYLPGFRVTWSRYFSLPQQLSPGGYLSDPVTDGLPVQFYSDTGAPGGNNVLTTLASLVAPQFFTSGISWLRMADNMEFVRTWFRVTATWVGGPAGGTNVNGQYYFGHWDTDIYDPTFKGYNLSNVGI